MGERITLDSVDFEYNAWEVRLSGSESIDGLTAGGWASNTPRQTNGILVRVPDAARLRQIATAQRVAADHSEDETGKGS